MPADAALAEALVAETVTAERIVVVDGDSVAIDGQEWRLRGFDAPEIERAKCEAERRLALIAKRRLEVLIRDGYGMGAEVAVVNSGERDRYKRPLGDLLIGGRNVREVLIAEDLARPYNGSVRKGWCSRDSRDDLIPGPRPARDVARKGG